MGRAVNFQQWQLENASQGITGKGTSSKIKFQGSRADFSEQFDARIPRKQRETKQIVSKKKDRKALLQYLKNSGMDMTCIIVPGKLKQTPEGWVVREEVKIINGFMWENQIRRDFPNAIAYYYAMYDERENDIDQCSSLFKV